MKIDGNTNVYGIFGWPISHTASPAMHNTAFRHLGLDAVYVPFHVPPGDIKRAVKSIIPLGISGVNITVPYKEVAFKLVDEVSRESRLIGAVNTIVVQGDKLIGHNTDGKGFIHAIREELSFTPRGKKVVVIGAGGSARAVTFQLVIEGVSSLTVVNRTLSRAKLLCQRLKKGFTHCHIEALLPRDERLFDLIDEANLLVNATSCGMKKNDPLLINPSSLHPRLLVYDLIYNLSETKLLKEARRKNLRCANGLSMLIHQGALSFELWTGRKAPIKIMRQSLKVGND